jgi:hypothetical protein
MWAVETVAMKDKLMVANWDVQKEVRKAESKVAN